MRRIPFTVILLCVCLLHFFPLTTSAQQKVRHIELLHADSLEYDEALTGKYKRLIGNVQFRHEDALMYCDSSYFFSETNYMEAFSRVHIVQGDSMNLYGDTLKYFGDTKKSELYGKIRLTDKSMTLTTDRLDYDMNTEIANYKSGGKIVDKDNVLTSIVGDYHTKKSECFFTRDVILDNPDFIILTDTLRYNTTSKVAYFEGPTTISGDESFIFCKHGWYNTEKDISFFSESAELCNQGYELRGDSITHDKGTGIARAYSNMSLIDTTQDVIISGDYGVHFDKKDSTFVTGNAMFTQIMDADSLFLHGDTLISFPDTTRDLASDSLLQKSERDTSAKKILAFHHVKIFKKDLQGKCDSMVYLTKDSMIFFYINPVLWTETNQLTAEVISILMLNGKMDKLFMSNRAFITSQHDTARYDQIKGKDMTGYFEDSELRKIFVEGNGETVYYAKDEKKKFMGVNKAKGANIWITVADSEVQRINILVSPEATFYPMKDLKPAELMLPDFLWRGQERPLSKSDIFIK